MTLPMLAGAGTVSASSGLTLTAVQQAQLELLRGAESEGLEPSDYAPADLERQAGAEGDLTYRQFSERLTVAFARYSRDLSQGRLDPAVDPDWHLSRQSRDTHDALPEFASAAEVEAFNETLLHPHPQYRRLRDTLHRLLDIRARGGWPQIAEGSELRSGSRDERVIPLRNRLRISSHYNAEMQADPLYFDAGLDAAVRRFQAEHGLWVDGTVESRTLDALNVPVEERIEQVKITLERWRWLPRDPGERYIQVNIVAAELQAIEDDKPLFSMRAIVGRPYRQTPSLQGHIELITFNPAWTVPRTIAVEDLLPLQQQDRTFFTRNRIRMFSMQDGREVDLQKIDWANMTPRTFTYTLRQDASPDNSLGRLRFSFDNPYDIYLHDTPNHILFQLPDRAFSSGCVRIEESEWLAEYLLTQDRQTSPQAVRALLETGTTRNVTLADAMPVYLVYLNVWADDEGYVHFGDDPYHRDQQLQSVWYRSTRDTRHAMAN